MKKFILMATLAMFSIAIVPGCSGSRGNSAGTTSTVTNSIIAILAGILQSIGNSTAANNLTQQTRLDAVLQGAEIINNFKNLLATTYQIPMPAIDKAYAGFTTVKSVANFVAKNVNQNVP